jgi:hypothetical protein
LSQALAAVIAAKAYDCLAKDRYYSNRSDGDHAPEINEAEALAERFEQRSVFSLLHRLRGVFLTAIGADETQIEASFCAAIKTAKKQKSVSLAKRAEATYAEYRRQKASASGGRGFRLPLG